MRLETLSAYIRALRAHEVRVSTSEAIDAAQAINLIGFKDKDILRDTLGLVLAKSPDEKDIHDQLFDLFFKATPVRREETSPRNEAPTDLASEDQMADTDLQTLSESGDEAAMALAIEQAARQVKPEDIRFSTQLSVYTQKIYREMGGEGLQKRLISALQDTNPQSAGEAAALMRARADIMGRIRGFLDQKYEIFGKAASEQFRQDYLAEKALTEVTRQDMARMKVLIDKLAKKLAAKHARRKRQRKTGQLDIRKTLRQNAGYEGLPFNLAWKQTRRERPSIVAICDVSGSVAQYVRFLLLLLYALHESIPKLSAFAFSGRLQEVSDIFKEMDFDLAMDRILKTIGMSSTDYGAALMDLKTLYWSKIDRHSSVIILGDGRSNYGPAQLDILRELQARAKRVIWLCPEPEALWGTGDSLIKRYQPYCSQLAQVSNLKDLERAIDETLGAYA